MTYQDYLKRWKQRFGDCDYHDTYYWQNGKRQYTTLKRLAQHEFYWHMEMYEELNVRFISCAKSNDESGMIEAVEESSQHELALLI